MYVLGRFQSVMEGRNRPKADGGDRQKSAKGSHSAASNTREAKNIFCLIASWLEGSAFNYTFFDFDDKNVWSCLSFSKSSSKVMISTSLEFRRNNSKDFCSSSPFGVLPIIRQQ